MRIFFPNASIVYPPTTGGHIHVYQLTKHLRELGHQIFSVQPDQSPITTTHPRRPAAVLDAVRTADVIYCRLAETPNNATRLTSSPWRWLVPERTAVVWELNVSLTGASTIEGRSNVQRRAHIAALRRSTRRVDAAIGVTDGLARQAQDLLRIERTAVIQNGSDPELFRRDRYVSTNGALDGGRLQVVSIGSNPNSYHDVRLLESLCERIDICQLPIDVHLFGKSAELIGRDVPRSLKLRGAVSYLEMPRHLAEMDVGLALYNIPLDLGSPLKLFDYLASGCVPICSAGQAVDQVLTGGASGFVRSDWTAESLCQVLLELHEDRTLLGRMRTTGRHLVEYEYNWGRIAEKTEAILTELVRDRQRGKAAVS